MRSGFLNRILVLLVVLLTAFSCREPDTQECFIPSSALGSDGLYHFTVDLSDSLALSYDISFYSRIDGSSLKINAAKDFPMLVTWVSPSGQRYGEKVYFGLHEPSEGSVFYSSQYRMLYLKDFLPKQPGIWGLDVRVDCPKSLSGFRGLGMICKTNREDGTQETD